MGLLLIIFHNVTFGKELSMWDPMPICIFKKKHIYHLFFLLVSVFHLTHNHLSPQHSQRSRMWAFKAYFLICNAYYYFAILKCLKFPLFISHNFLTRTCPLDKKKNTCFTTQIMHTTLDHLFITKRSFFDITLIFHIHIRKANLPST
jgi:hypothetical protein